MKKYTLAELQKLVDDQTQGRGGYWPEEMILRHAHKELSEIGEAMDFESGALKPKPGQKIPNIPYELADALYALICFANRRGVDLAQALIEKKGIIEERDKDRFKKSDKSKPQYGSGRDGGDGDE